MRRGGSGFSLVSLGASLVPPRHEPVGLGGVRRLLIFCICELGILGSGRRREEDAKARGALINELESTAVVFDEGAGKGKADARSTRVFA